MGFNAECTINCRIDCRTPKLRQWYLIWVRKILILTDVLGYCRKLDSTIAKVDEIQKYCYIFIVFFVFIVNGVRRFISIIIIIIHTLNLRFIFTDSK